MRIFNYLTHGLSILSEVFCPELLPAPKPISKTDVVHIRYGPVHGIPADVSGNGCYSFAKPNYLLLWLDGIAGFLIRNGNEIIVDPAPKASDDEIRLFLLGSALGALLYQRGRLVIHGSAIQTAHGAIVFVGPSAVGKSTLAAAFQSRGNTVLSDDLCAIGLNAFRVPWIYPGLDQIKLWADAAKKLAYNAGSGHRVRPEDDKYRFPLNQRGGINPVPLYGVYQLMIKNKQQVRLEWLTEGELFRVLLKNTYRNHLIEQFGVQADHFKQITAVTRRVKKACRISRPEKPFTIDTLVNVIEENFTT